MVEFPIEFSSHTKTNQASMKWKSSSNGELEVGIPKEFGGVEVMSPEDLFQLSIVNCFIATFKVMTKSSFYIFEEIEVISKLTMDKDDKSIPYVKNVHLDIIISGNKDEEKTKKLLNKAFSSCYVHKAVKVEITHEFKLK